MVVANHLVQWSYEWASSDVFPAHERLFYFKKKDSGREVDFVLKHGRELYPFEVKYQDSVGKRDLNGLFSFHKGVLVSKADLNALRDYATIPVELLLMLL